MSGINSYDKFYHRVLENMKVKEGGGFNCIPLPFERLSDDFPGIQKGKQVIITANSGVGKTQITKFLYVFWPYVWCKANPDSGITFKCKYFALEESEEEFIASVNSFFLYWEKGIICDSDEIMSMRYKISEKIIQALAEIKPVVLDFLDKVQIIDSVSNPYGIYKDVREYSNENGTHYYYNFREDPDKKNLIDHNVYAQIQDKDNWAYSHYEPFNPNEYFTVVVDHIGLLQKEKGLTLHESIGKLSADYGRKNITKHWKYIFVLVQQQNSKSEYLQFDNKGKNIIDKLRPSLSELANNTETQRDALICWGLFAPDRYKIPTYHGYRISVLRDNFRELTLLKNRGGTPNLMAPLYFNGASNFFSEYPKLDKDEVFSTLNIGDLEESKWYNEFKKNREFWINN